MDDEDDEYDEVMFEAIDNMVLQHESSKAQQVLNMPVSRL